MAAISSRSLTSVRKWCAGILIPIALEVPGLDGHYQSDLFSWSLIMRIWPPDVKDTYR